MNDKATDGRPDEQALVKLYMELTGATESNARSVLMYVSAASEALDGAGGAKKAAKAPPL